MALDTATSPPAPAGLNPARLAPSGRLAGMRGVDHERLSAILAATPLGRPAGLLACTDFASSVANSVLLPFSLRLRMTLSSIPVIRSSSADAHPCRRRVSPHLRRNPTRDRRGAHRERCSAACRSAGLLMAPDFSSCDENSGGGPSLRISRMAPLVIRSTRHHQPDHLAQRKGGNRRQPRPLTLPVVNADQPTDDRPVSSLIEASFCFSPVIGPLY